MSDDSRPSEDALRSALSENWTHARHQEDQRASYARLFVTLVVAVFAYLKGSLGTHGYLLFSFAILGIFGVLFTVKTNHEFDNHMRANKKIIDQLRLTGLMGYPTAYGEESSIFRYIRIRWLYIGLYLLLIGLCFIAYFVG